MEKLSGVRPALGQTRAHGGGRQNSQTESEEEKNKTKSFRQFTDTAVISQQSRSTEPQTAQSVSREPNKQFCQALKFKAIKGGGPVVPLPPGCFHSTAQNSSQKPRSPRRTENTSSWLSLPFIGAFFFSFFFAFARVFKKKTTPKSSANSAFKNPFMRLPPKSTERNVFSSFC